MGIWSKCCCSLPRRRGRRLTHSTNSPAIAPTDPPSRQKPTPTQTNKRLFPPFSSIRAVSARVAARVAEFAVREEGVGDAPEGVAADAGRGEWVRYFERRMWGSEAPARSRM